MTQAITSKILYIEDDSDDCYFLNLSLSETGTNTNLICANDGESAIQYLNSISSPDLPSLIILDLNMPKWDGKQTLGYIKSQPHLTNIPVVILSTSDNMVDREVCTILGANSYFTKPYHFDGYREIIKNFISYLSAE